MNKILFLKNNNTILIYLKKLKKNLKQYCFKSC